MGLPRYAIWTLYFAAFIGGLSSSIYIPAALQIAQELQASPDNVKLLLTVYLVGVSLGSLVVGPLADRFGVKKMFVLSFIMYTLANLLSMYVTDINLFIPLRIIQGLGAVSGATLSLAIVTKHLKGAEYRVAMYTVVSLISLGPAIGPTLGSGLLLLDNSWRFLFFFLFLGSALCTLSLLFSLRSEPSEISPFFKQIKLDVAMLYDNYYFWGYCILAGIGFGCFFLFLSISPFVFVKHFQWDHLQFSLVGVGAALGMSGGSIFERIFLTNWDAQKSIFLGFMISLASSFIILLGALISNMDGFMFLILSTLVLFGCGLIATSAIAEAMLYTKEYSRASAAVIIFVKIGLSAVISVFATAIPGSPFAIGLLFFIIVLTGLAKNHLLHTRKPKQVK